jgi:EAL domain-containing protein (putative c-di-GMP-specific phosphodiesterase class I)
MDNPEQATAALSELRAIGMQIAVDDFGTGYSSLSHLQRFPVDVLKIDKSFIDALDVPESGSSALVTAIIALARSLHLGVVAEGIEREKQLEQLIRLGCDYAQGNLLARPLDGHGARMLIEEYEGTTAPI